MKIRLSHPKFQISALSIALLTSGFSYGAVLEDVSNAVKDSKVNILLRYRIGRAERHRLTWSDICSCSGATIQIKTCCGVVHRHWWWTIPRKPGWRVRH